MNIWRVGKNGELLNAAGNPINEFEREQIVADANRLNNIRNLMPEIKRNASNIKFMQAAQLARQLINILK